MWCYIRPTDTTAILQIWWNIMHSNLYMPLWCITQKSSTVTSFFACFNFIVSYYLDKLWIEIGKKKISIKFSIHWPCRHYGCIKEEKTCQHFNLYFIFSFCSSYFIILHKLHTVHLWTLHIFPWLKCSLLVLLCKWKLIFNFFHLFQIKKNFSLFTAHTKIQNWIW